MQPPVIKEAEELKEAQETVTEPDSARAKQQCTGCGVVLQSSRPGHRGFIEEKQSKAAWYEHE